MVFPCEIHIFLLLSGIGKKMVQAAATTAAYDAGGFQHGEDPLLSAIQFPCLGVPDG